MKRELCCPECVPSGMPDDFCIPKEYCPEIIDTPKYPSPTTCLPEEQQIELEERIEEVNNLLLDLALSNRQEGLEEQDVLTRQNILDGLIGIEVSVKINGLQDFKKRRRSTRRKKKKGKGSWVKGCIELVGRNFLLLLVKDSKRMIVPLHRICSIKSVETSIPPITEPRFLETDPCFRRSLAFNFGETVSCSPELIHIFYRIDLKIYLLQLLDKKITVITPAKKITGVLVGNSEESVSLCIKEDVVKELSMDEILIIKYGCS